MSPATSIALGARPLFAGEAHLANRRELAGVLLTCCIASVVLALVLGRDLNWDYFNYHGYAALSVFGDRISQDFFPAGYQGYLNPLAFAPFAWMQRAGWSSPVIAASLAALQSLNFVFLYLIVREHVRTRSAPILCAALITALGAVSSVIASQIGSTFVDPTTTPLVMASLWLAMRARSTPGLLVAAALSGGAVALKWTNAPFALALVLAIPLLTASRAPKPVLRSWATAGLGAALGFALLYGWWGWRLYTEFGSPVFPLFNGVFRAPDFSAEATSFHRFIPQSALAALGLPLAMASHDTWIYTEVSAPDLRPLALALVVVVALLRVVLAKASIARDQPPQPHVERPPLRFLWLFCGVSIAGWLATSANGRYATPLLLLLGPLLWLASRAAFGERGAFRVCAVLLVLQALQVATAGNPRWSPHPWTREWLPVRVPATLQSDPLLFVAIGKSSESYLAAHVHPRSVFVNPIGLTPIAAGGPGWQRFESLRDRFAGRTQVLFPVPADPASPRLPRLVQAMNDAVDRLGLSLRADACERIVANDAPVVWPSEPSLKDQPGGRHVLSCAASIVSPGSARLAEIRARVIPVMDAFERKCPALFAPRHSSVEAGRRFWSRFYGKYDVDLTLDIESGLLTYAMERQPVPVAIAHLDNWQRDLSKFDCRLPHDGRRDVTTLSASRPAP